MRMTALAIDDGGVHANLADSYFSGCVFVADFYGRSPIGAVARFDVKYDIKEAHRHELETRRLSASEAKALQEAAWLAVRNGRVAGVGESAFSRPR